MTSTSALSFLMLMTFPLLGGNDLLDLVSSEAYWKSKHVERSVEAMLSELQADDPPDISALVKQLGADKFRDREAAMKAIRAAGPGVIDQLRNAAAGPDAEIADRAETLIEQLGGGLLTTAERRLMAIRTLGELKQREALPRLSKLAASREPFVAEYAKAAIASIEGKPYQRPRPTQAQRDEDLRLLPKECVFVMQAGAERRIAVSWEQILRLVAQLPNDRQRDQQPSERVKKYEAAFRTLLERSGNVRVDLATVGVTGNIFTADGVAVVVFRGRYHVDGFKEEAAKMGFARTTIDGVDVVQHPRDQGTAILLVSDERLVVVSGRERSAAIEQMIAASKRNRGTFDQNAKLAALVQTVDRSKAIWGATMPTDSERGLLGIDSLKSMTLEVSQDQGALAAACKVEATDFAAMKQKLEEIMTFRTAVAPALDAEVARSPHLKPLTDLLKSLALSDDGTSFTITARAPDAAALLTLPVVEGRRAVEK